MNIGLNASSKRPKKSKGPGPVLLVSSLLFLLLLFAPAPVSAEGNSTAEGSATAEGPSTRVSGAEGRSTAEGLYGTYCASCHGADRFGSIGPPLTPEYFGRKSPERLFEIIRDGLPATNHPGLGKAAKGPLTDADIDSLVTLIRTPIESPVWGLEEMRSTWESSQIGLFEGKTSKYDLTNFLMIVEGGAGTVHFMDGDSLKLLGKTHVGAMHGGPKFSPDLKYAYLSSRDGWLVKYDLVDLKAVAKLRAGISARNISVSSDGDHIIQANLLPKNLVVINAFSMKPVKVIEPGGTIGSVYTLREKGKFVVSMKDSPEVLLIDDKTFEITTIKTEKPFIDFFIDPGEGFLIGSERGGEELIVLDIKTGKVVGRIAGGGGMPHLASAAVWSGPAGAPDGTPGDTKDEGKKTFAAFPHIGRPLLTVIELYEWRIVGQVKTRGAGYFARTHKNIDHIWVDSGTDTIELVDKKTLKVTATVTPEKGKKAMHVEFTKDGSHALVSIWETDGAVVIYETSTLKEVSRFPFKKPIGKYNATNKRF